jgi:hypothetical protein
MVAEYTLHCNGKFMISNERTPFYARPHYGSPKPPIQEDTLRSEQVQVERKTFVFTLKENPRGRFLRITEGANGRRDTIIIPAPGLEEFKTVVELMLKAAGEEPSESDHRDE